MFGTEAVHGHRACVVIVKSLLHHAGHVSGPTAADDVVACFKIKSSAGIV